MMLNTLCKDVIKLATTSLLATVLLSVVGCALMDESAPNVDSTTQNGIINNGIINNGIINNGIINNGIINNGIINNGADADGAVTFNGFSFNPAHSAGLSVNGLGLDAVAIHGLQVNGTGSQGITIHGTQVSSEQEIDLLVLLRYAIECALAEDQSATIADTLGTPYEFQGAMGLAPEWRTGALSATGRRYVSACLAARSNAIGRITQISVRGGNIPTTPVELATYTHTEGSFWGDVFGSNPTITTCAVQGGGISGRVCTTGDCSFAFAGDCADVCASQDAADGHYSDCKGELAVITTFLPITSNTKLGKDHGCVLENGMPWCWGKNDQGQLGDGTNIDRPALAPRSFGGQVAEIAGGGYHTCARLASGEVFCTGDNQYGQLGIDSSAQQSYQPRQVSAVGADTVSIAAGSKHTCALKSDGTVRCWGDNFHGQLGDGTTTMSAEPVEITALGQDVVRLGMDDSADHSCVVTREGSVKCWGWNSAGQLGDGSTQDRSLPVVVDQDASGNSLDQVIDVCTGWLHTCVQRANGEVLCFGSNDSGRLGDPALTASMATRPVRVDLPAPAVQGSLSCGTDHTCAILNDGTARCWGGNEHGQLGNGTRDAEGLAAPAPVIGLNSSIASISADAYRTCATLDDGSMHCWGQDRTGGLHTSVAAPVEIATPDINTYAPASFSVVFNASQGTSTSSWVKHMSPDLVSYELYRNGQFISNLGASKVSGTDSRLAPGTYCYKLRAVLSDGTTSDFTQELCGSLN
jgi:alpha-tubulin suppressor-like RCC1 family protein